MENNHLTGWQIFTIIAVAIFLFSLVVISISNHSTSSSTYVDYLNEQRGDASTAINDMQEMCDFCNQDYYCANMGTCEQATFCLKKCAMTRLDADNDGIPCETLCH